MGVRPPRRRVGADEPVEEKEKRAWQDSNLRHTAPETVALSPELQARAKGRPPGNVTVRRVPLQRSCGSDCR
jgi:hypothetical protein